jgi:nucleotide-binding universal stress UspA family protein
MSERILVPVDLAHVDKLTTALGIAAGLARQSGASVVFLGVVEAVPTTSSKTEGDKQAALLQDFARAQSKAHGIDATAHTTLRGDFHLTVGRDIIAAAEQTGCDLIVMASHVPGLKEHVLSSNAGYVASHAPMSVYVIR